MKELADRLAHTFSWQSITHYVADTLAPNLIVATLVFLAFWLAHKLLRTVLKAGLERAHLDETAKQFILALLKYLIFTIATVATLNQFGVDTGALIASLGVAGLTLGFAAKDALSNVISGLFIFWDRPFVVGDLIEVEGEYGRVQEITMRTTRVVTVDGKMLAVPNTTVVNTTVASYTNFPGLRLDVSVTIGVNEDLGFARESLIEAISADGGYKTTPAPDVVVKSLNDYNIELSVRAWIEDERQHVAQRFHLRELVFLTLRSKEVEMPYETIQLLNLPVPDAADALATRSEAQT